jgi:hypothetical protein
MERIRSRMDVPFDAPAPTPTPEPEPWWKRIWRDDDDK